MPATHPHILKICTDQHAPNVLGYAGDPHVRTPHLDALAAGGTRFDNHYAACPICVPGRFSMLSGRMPSELGAPYFECTLPPDTPTYMRHFAQRGYQTTCVGKMHFHGQEQMHGWMFRPYGDMQVPHHHAQYVPDYAAKRDVTGGRLERPVDMAAEGGYNSWMLKHAGPGETGNQRWDASVTRETVENLKDYFTPSFIDEIYQGDRPLLFEVSFKTPHCPFVCEQGLFDHYMEVLPPPRHPELPEGYAAFVRRKAANDLRGEPTAAMERRARAAYWGLVEWVDARIGEVLACLEELGVRDQFVVQFTADHGEMAGENGLWQKHLPHEMSARVPFLLQGPGIPAGRVVRENTSHLDLFPTLCDLAGLDAPDHLGDAPWHGRSMLPLLADDAAGERIVLSEFRAHRDDVRAEGLPDGIWWVMAKRGDVKLVDYGSEAELFDLSEDPDERRPLPEKTRKVGDLREVIDNYRRSVRN